MKLINNELVEKKLQKGMFFKAGGLNIFGNKNQQTNIIEATRVIIDDGLLPNEVKEFSAVVPYPSHFKNIYLSYKLYCH